MYGVQLIARISTNNSGAYCYYLHKRTEDSASDFIYLTLRKRARCDITIALRSPRYITEHVTWRLIFESFSETGINYS